MEKVLQLEGKKILVFGTGLSGIAAAELLIRHGISIILYDGNDKQKEEDIRQNSPN